MDTNTIIIVMLIIFLIMYFIYPLLNVQHNKPQQETYDVSLDKSPYYGEFIYDEHVNRTGGKGNRVVAGIHDRSGRGIHSIIYPGNH